MNANPHVAVLGCGAIGGIVAAGLTRVGLRVTPVTGNEAIARSLSQHGYRVREVDGGEWSVMPSAAPRVSLDDGDGPPIDVCIAVTQSTRLRESLEGARPHLAPGAAVLCLQNGLPEDCAAEVVPREQVAGCVVGFGASMIEPGLYQRTSHGGFQLGRPFAESQVDLDVVRALLDPAAPARLVEDLAAVRWSKLAINCCTTTLGAIGGRALGPLLRRRYVRRLALEVFAEVAAVARATGVRPARVAGTLDIAKIAISDEERRLRYGSPALAVKHSVLLAVGFKYRRLRSSMLYALERGRPPEIDFLNGEVVRRGVSFGVPTPVNRALVDEVRSILSGASSSSPATLERLHQRLVS